MERRRQRGWGSVRDCVRGRRKGDGGWRMEEGKGGRRMSIYFVARADDNVVYVVPEAGVWTEDGRREGERNRECVVSA